MRMPIGKRTGYVFLTGAVITALCATALAQTSGSEPQSSGQSFSELVAGLAIRASQLMPYLQNEIIGKLAGWIQNLAIVLSSLIMLGSFLRIWRESNGQGANLFWWFARLGVCFSMMLSGPLIIQTMYQVGNDIARGNELAGKDGDSLLYEFYRAQRDSFNESYSKLTQGTFTVKVDGQDFPVAPSDGSNTFLGVVFDQEGTVRDLRNRMNDSTWMMTTMYAWLNVARGILEWGDFALIIIAGILMMSFRALSPFAVVMAIDQKLSQRFTYPFTWGAIILTLIWPSVSYFIRGLAYLAGNMAMALGDSNPVYTWDAASLRAVRSPLAQPIYTVGFAALIMTIVGLSLWLSPLLAYRISMGQVYEGVSSAVSGWMAAITSTALELFASLKSAALNQEAANIQAEAGYGSSTTQAGGEFQAANLAARARQTMGVGAVRGNQSAQLSQIYASRTNQLLTTQAGMQLGIDSAAATTALAKGDIGVRTGQQVNELQIGRTQSMSSIEANRAADTQDFVGKKVNAASSYAGNKIDKGADYAGQKVGGNTGSAIQTGGSLVGTGVEVGGAAYGWHEQYKSIQNRASGQSQAINQATDARIANQQQTQQGLIGNQDSYLQRVTANQESYAHKVTEAANLSAGQAAGGVNRGANIQIHAINEGTRMELAGNQTRYDAQIHAAEINRSAAIEAARLQAFSSVIQHVGYLIAKDIERGMEMRF